MTQQGFCLPGPVPTGSLLPGLLPLLPPEPPLPQPPRPRADVWQALTAPRLEPCPPQAWLQDRALLEEAL